MRKTRVLALVVASLVSTASIVGAQAPATGQQGGRHAIGRGIEGRGGPGGALRGLTLSETEKTKVKEIRAKYMAESKTLRESLKPTFQEGRTMRQKGDTAGFRALMDRNKPAHDQLQALHVRQQAEIRAALTTENQKLFDARVQERERRVDGAKNRKAGKQGGRRAGIRGAGRVG